MSRTAILIDPRYRAHDPGPGHPERPDRIAVLEDMVHSWHGSRLDLLSPRLAEPDEICAVHSPDLVAQVEKTQGMAHARLDADTRTSARSFEVALLAAGGFLELTDAVAERANENGFAFVRPPGHHATKDHSMGFCLFNNVAVAAQALKRKYGYQRIAIIDYDLHHGNGTEALFYDDPTVLYVSLHQYPYYPGTGAATDVGTGPGEGFTVNVPFSAGVGDAGYLMAFDEIITPILRHYAPEFVLVSAGFDCHHRDPLGGMRVSEQGFVGFTKRLLGVAREVADGRMATILEGGYDLDAIRNSAEAVLTTMSAAPCVVPESASNSEVFEPLKKILRPYWPIL